MDSSHLCQKPVRRGVSIAETVAALMIVTIMASAVFVSFQKPRQGVKETSCHQHRELLNLRVVRYYQANHRWPSDDLREILPSLEVTQCPVDGSAYRLDAKSHTVVEHAH